MITLNDLIKEEVAKFDDVWILSAYGQQKGDIVSFLTSAMRRVGEERDREWKDLVIQSFTESLNKAKKFLEE